MMVARLAMIAVLFGCHGEDPPQAPFLTPEALVSAGSAKVAAMCACKDKACRTGVLGGADDPFGPKGRPVLKKLSAEQKKQWSDLMMQWTQCIARP